MTAAEIATLPTVDLEKRVPADLTVVPERRMPVPVTKALVSFEPDRHLVMTPRLDLKAVAIRARPIRALVCCSWRDIDQEETGCQQQAYAELVHDDLL